MAFLEIQKNIPIPDKGWARLADVVRKMEIGDMFEVDRKTKDAYTAQNAAKRIGFKLITRKISNEVTGIWRIE